MTMIALIVPIIMLFAMILAVLLLIVGHIDIIVPFITHEIDGSAACIILAAVLAPFFLVAGRYMQVDRLINNTGRRGLNHDGS